MAFHDGIIAARTDQVVRTGLVIPGLKAAQDPIRIVPGPEKFVSRFPIHRVEDYLSKDLVARSKRRGGAVVSSLAFLSRGGVMASYLLTLGSLRGARFSPGPRRAIFRERYLSRSQDMPHRHTATILPFDPTRTRPGLRVLMTEARRRIQDGAIRGEWRAPEGRNGVTPQTLCSLLGPDETLYALHTADVCDRAIEAAIGAIYALHDGIWLPRSPGQELQSMMALQSEASRISKLPLVQAALAARTS